MGLESALQKKYDRLLAYIGSYEKIVLAYSGGVDSTLLLKVIAQVLPAENIIAVIAESPTFPQEESIGARAICEGWGVPYAVITTEEMNDANFVNNPEDRCYFCKRELFNKILQYAYNKGITYIFEGSNAEDIHDHRPGLRALRELGIKSPLLECGLSKDEIRALSREFGVPTAAKPSLACLSSRIPYGTQITEKVLKMVHDAEKIIRLFGVTQCRVRHYGDCARIEVEPKDIGTLTRHEIRTQICEALKKIGYKYITLDLEGYRSGSMNLVLTTNDKEERDEKA
ncbi:MAG: ATP-dependent sacrificial sulfur transferase LarE [Candidatus Omnitrophica bacterium]|nr:ATP-dependent sacrificial sulfur transferase LarE [Candidatus Omnitrophota bacterium]